MYLSLLCLVRGGPVVCVCSMGWEKFMSIGSDDVDDRSWLLETQYIKEAHKYTYTSRHYGEN